MISFSLLCCWWTFHELYFPPVPIRFCFTPPLLCLAFWACHGSAWFGCSDHRAGVGRCTTGRRLVAGHVPHLIAASVNWTGSGTGMFNACACTALHLFAPAAYTCHPFTSAAHLLRLGRCRLPAARPGALFHSEQVSSRAIISRRFTALRISPAYATRLPAYLPTYRAARTHAHTNCTRRGPRLLPVLAGRHLGGTGPVFLRTVPSALLAVCKARYLLHFCPCSPAHTSYLHTARTAYSGIFLSGTPAMRKPAVPLGSGLLSGTWLPHTGSLLRARAFAHARGSGLVLRCQQHSAGYRRAALRAPRRARRCALDAATPCGTATASYARPFLPYLPLPVHSAAISTCSARLLPPLLFLLPVTIRFHFPFSLPRLYVLCTLTPYSSPPTCLLYLQRPLCIPCFLFMPTMQSFWGSFSGKHGGGEGRPLWTRRCLRDSSSPLPTVGRAVPAPVSQAGTLRHTGTTRTFYPCLPAHVLPHCCLQQCLCLNNVPF